MKNPWTVQILCKGKGTIVAGMKEGEQYVYFDSEGLVVDKSAVKKMVPLVEGITLTSSGEYKVLECADAKLFSEVLDACRELQNYNLSVDKITCRNDRNLFADRKCKSKSWREHFRREDCTDPANYRKTGRAGRNSAFGKLRSRQETITFEKAKKSK